jgi:hypothetical protein
VIAMAIHSIDYMNARRALLPASGGTNYRKPVNPVDLRAAQEGKDSLDLAHDAVLAIFADFRAFLRTQDNALAAARLSPELAGDQPIPF